MQERPNKDESLTGILDAAARIGTVAVAFYIARSVVSAVKQTKGGLDEIADVWRNQAKAERDMQRTLREQDEKDTQQIRKDIRDDQVERERKKLKIRDQGGRGHWEGNVFIPYVDTTKRPKSAKATER